MWCEHCQHDVPNSPKADGVQSGYCADCGGELVQQVLAVDAAPTQAAEVELTPMTATTESAIWSTWELNEQLRHVERVLSAARPTPLRLDNGDRLRFDPPRRINRSVVDLPTTRSHGHPLASGVIWVVTAIGTVILACGAVLAAWGWVGHRTELWQMGVPAVLVGQFALL
ncbi:MAG TPA: hypothetical protein VHV77_04950, partial [Pirellulales bacterium]|nr:hypothetical protein [Pirellulales bacterium]